ncbi:MAG: DUF1800 family protein [Pseudomonadota bacterium]
MMARAYLYRLMALWVGVAASIMPASAQEVSQDEAARFLLQSSFGPDPDSIRDVQRLGYAGWLQQQMALPLPSVAERVEKSYAAGDDHGSIEPLIALFWEQALYGDDQLRQRMRFALSQIVVASLEDPATRRAMLAYLDYVDMLGEEALGNYCTLIRRVTFQPTMALFLTYYENQKADEERGVVPDENYAREIMQLFTIGLEELALDGTPSGRPTYRQDDVSGLASVFTGLALPGENFRNGKANVKTIRGELIGYPDFHEPGEKRFLGAVIDPGQDAVASVNAALDYLLAHPNVAPFVAKQLIQKLVTSNPSPAYIERVARAFNEGEFKASNDVRFGAGQRCDLQATTAAILLDPEARQRPGKDDQYSGKVREPLIRVIHLLRTFASDRELTDNGLVPYSNFLKSGQDSWAYQTPFRSPTVFNFYRPSYAKPGSEVDGMGAVAPETQTMTVSHLATQTTWLSACIVRGVCEKGDLYQPALAPFMTAADRPKQLVEMLDLYLTGSSLMPKTKRRITTALWSINVPYDRRRQEALEKRLATAITMVTTAPEFMVQR